MDWLSKIDDERQFVALVEPNPRNPVSLSLAVRAILRGIERFPDEFEAITQSGSLRLVAAQLSHPLHLFGMTLGEIEPMLPALDLDEPSTPTTLLLSRVSIIPPSDEALEFVRWSGELISERYIIESLTDENSYARASWSRYCATHLGVGLSQSIARWAARVGIPIDYMCAAYDVGHSQNSIEAAWVAGTPLEYLLAAAP